MKNKKILIVSIIVAILVIVSAVAGFLYYQSTKNNDFIIGETENITEPLNYLAKGENNEYHLIKANADIKFQVETEAKELKYKVIDEEANEIETTSTKIEDYYEIVNNQNYEAGKTYTLTLENAKFKDEKLKDVTKLNFTIVRPNANTQVLNDNIKKTNNKTIINVEESADNYILTSKKEYQKDDILYIENTNNIQVFKVDTISKDNDNYKITTTTPKLEEIYKELDIYGEFTPKITDFIPNKDLEQYVKVAVLKSNIVEDLIDSLDTKVYAAENELIQVEIKPQNDGSVKAIVTINLIGNENSFIDVKDIKNHEITFEMEMLLKLKTFNEINFSKTDVGANIDIEITKSLAIKPKEEYWKDFNKEEEKNDIECLEKAKEILKSIKEDTAEENQNLGTIKIPTPITGITVDFGLDLVEEFKIAFELNSSETTTIHTKFGYKDGIKKVNQVGFYWNSYNNVTQNQFKAVGKAEIKIGLEAKLEINFIEVIKIGANTGAGTYAEGQINYIASKDDKQTIDGKFEYGFYIDGKVYGKIVGVTVAEKTIYDKKWKLAEYNRDILEEKRIEAEKKAEEERKAKEEAQKKSYVGTYKNNLGQTMTITINDSGDLYLNDFGDSDKINIEKKNKDGAIIITQYPNYGMAGTYIYPAGINISIVTLGTFDSNGNWVDSKVDNTKIRIVSLGSAEPDISGCYYKVN